MSRWFRVYDDLVDDPKVQMLPDRTFRALINLWCLASRNEGVLPPLEQIAFSLRMKPEKVFGLLAELRVARLIEDEDGAIRPHNWIGRQFKSDVSNERVKRHRERHRNVTEAVTDTVTATPPETETDTETESPSLRSGGARAKTRATRIPENFEPDLGEAEALGMAPDDAASEAASFVDYWRAKPSNATKLDWPATWRVWCRKAVKDRDSRPQNHSRSNGKSSGHNTMLGALFGTEQTPTLDLTPEREGAKLLGKR